MPMESCGRLRLFSAAPWRVYSPPLFLVLFGLLFAATTVYCRGCLSSLPAWLCSVIVISAAALIIKNIDRNRFGFLFTLSSVLFAGLWGIAASVHYPNLVQSLDGNNTLTFYNASSSLLTLKVMLIIAMIGMPLVIGYTIFAYRVFKGKAQP